MLILLVDDDKLILKSHEKLIKNEGHQVVTAVDGQDALFKLKKNPTVGLIITDLQMPKLNGYRFAEKAIAMTKAPILLHTGNPYAERKNGIKVVIGKGDWSTLKFWIKELS